MEISKNYISVIPDVTVNHTAIWLRRLHCLGSPRNEHKRLNYVVVLHGCPLKSLLDCQQGDQGWLCSSTDPKAQR